MLTKELVTHNPCEQIRSSDVLGEKALQGTAIKAARYFERRHLIRFEQK
jgi:hypothetical protein